MARQLAWSPEAVEDTQAIAAYIERDSPRYAQIVVSRIFDMAEEVLGFPETGRVVPEIGKQDIRERFVYSSGSFIASRQAACSSLLLSMAAACYSP